MDGSPHAKVQMHNRQSQSEKLASEPLWYKMKVCVFVSEACWVRTGTVGYGQVVNSILSPM